ncbi:MAG TPA: NAD-dependent deacylase [Acidobacteriota bacterium]|nr:NAD-dependent deacylase [Acidobacteriota bacterium]
MDNEQFSNTFLSLLKRSQRIVVSTGAGISEESGVPTFRGPGGLWNDFKPEDLATPEAFARDPGKVWEWYNWRRELLKKVQPNAGHIALAELERMVPQLTLVTQNIDGLHQKSGSRNVQELHGNIWRVRCDLEHKTFELPDSPIQKLPPECECGQLLRPDVVWFGEPLPYEPTSRAWQAARQSEVFFLVGSSATVQPAASLPWVALEHGALVVEINPEETPVTAIAHESFRCKSGEILPQLVEAIRNHE